MWSGNIGWPGRDEIVLASACSCLLCGYISQEPGTRLCVSAKYCIEREDQGWIARTCVGFWLVTCTSKGWICGSVWALV